MVGQQKAQGASKLATHHNAICAVDKKLERRDGLYSWICRPYFDTITTNSFDYFFLASSPTKHLGSVSESKHFI